MTSDIDRDPRVAADLARLGSLLGVRPPRPAPARVWARATATGSERDEFETAVVVAATRVAEEQRMRWYTRWEHWRGHLLSGGPRPLVVRYLPPDWMSYLLWYSRHTQAWVLELRDGRGLIVMDENRALARYEVYAAQSWACTRWTDRLDERCYAWLPVIVARRRGWTPMVEPHWRYSRLYHDLHCARDADSCCTW